MPILTGLAIGAALGGGIAALQGGDILKGALMGGAGGALGGAFMPAVAGVGTGVASGTAASTPIAAANAIGSSGLYSGATASGIGSTAGGAGALAFPVSVGTSVAAPLASGVTSGVAGAGGISGLLSQYQYPLMGGLAGGVLGGAAQPESSDDQDLGNIREYSFEQEANPLFGNPGEAYFKTQQFNPGTVTPAGSYGKANGGIIALADGGDVDRYTRPIRTADPAVAAYNAQLMERANQQYNVNARPGPNQVPGSAGYVAPPPRVATPMPEDYESLGGYYFDPVTGKFTEGKKTTPAVEELVSDSSSYSGLYDGGGNFNGGNNNANGGAIKEYAQGGISSLGGYSDGGQLLKGPGDGVSDNIPAQIGTKQPARLADGEFVLPSRIVSELGNGSTDAGAKRLYAMMNRVQKGRSKSIGKGRVAVDSKASKYLPA